jgi:hypothetical protein
MSGVNSYQDRVKYIQDFGLYRESKVMKSIKNDSKTLMI